LIKPAGSPKDAVGGHRHDEAVAWQRLQQQAVVMLAAGGSHHADDLGAAGGEADPRGVGSAGERGGGGRGGVGRALHAHDPAGVAQALGVAEAAHAQPTRVVQAAVAPGDRLVGDPENVGDRAERRPAVELKRVQELGVEQI